MATPPNDVTSTSTGVELGPAEISDRNIAILVVQAQQARQACKCLVGIVGQIVVSIVRLTQFSIDGYYGR
jgi:hypothetical protein